MKSLSFYAVLAASLMIGYAPVGQAADTISPTGSMETNFVRRRLANVQVINENGQPVAGASVMIGTAPGQPFANNVVTTNANGVFATPSAWNRELPVTITAAGQVQTTYLNVRPQMQALAVTSVDGDQELEIKGQTTDFGTLRVDGKVDLAIVIPAFKRDDLLRFDLSQVLSPQTDRLDLGVAAFDLPSNIALPNQTESYIVPITIKKEDYRFFVRKPGNYQFTGIRAQFPVRKVVNAFRAGESIYTILNDFEFVSSGQLEAAVSQNINGQNISVAQNQFADTVPVASPTLPSDIVQINLAMVDIGGVLVPTDLKSLRSNQNRTMKTKKALGDVYMLSLLTREATTLMGTSLFNVMDEAGTVTPQGVQFDPTKFSFVLKPAQATATAPDFLAFTPPPAVNGNAIALTVPAAVAGVTPIKTQLIFSEVETITNGNVKTEKRTRLWEMSAPGWVASVALPQTAVVRDPQKKYRWEVMFIGGPTTRTSNLSSITHVSRSQLDL